MPTSEFQDPDVVLGQEIIEGTGRNQNEKVSASSLQYPSGIWTNGEKVMIADAWNHRVLIWLSFPKEHGQPADVVLGQPDFESNEPNVKGLGHNPSARTL